MTARSARHLVSLRDVEHPTIDWITARGLSHASSPAVEQSLRGKVAGTYFSLTSTRTRTAFVY